ncbi:MAG: 8-oxo-dGTP diphosphatase [Luteococcus sp.]|uniref:NUDIX hydrolase n=1 Tax=Luteococcus sp. TaxID=1969402 RepID=UPI0026480254|nr:8-oxo-dGTP diphosphatase [Luteococcus sp.]MDN5564762.1 8-oxo-dGTP diphosphatase [Luteococcus sp.]
MALTPIMTTLAFVRHPDGERVLMVHRTARAGDEQLGKYNGLGGKLEPDEDVVACIRRELREEAGIEATGLRLRGTVSWPGFGRNGEDHFGCIFVVDGFTGDVPEANEEGSLSWERIDELDRLPMWEGDRHFLPLVFDETITQFHGCLPYRDGRPTGWSVTTL